MILLPQCTRNDVIGIITERHSNWNFYILDQTLVRKWSNNGGIFNKKTNETRIKENRVILIPFLDYNGDEFARYRQFRTATWYEGMRINRCKKIVSNDHAFGFILNTLERRRIELLGRKDWRGMDSELIFNYTWQWIYRPLLNNIIGKARIVEAFYPVSYTHLTLPTIYSV